MDLMEIRRGLLMQMAGASKVKSGTFTGDGTTTVAIDIGFEPDVVVINSGHPYNEEDFIGLISCVLAKGVITINCCHNTATMTNALMYGNPIAEGQDEWGAKDSPANYTSYATYSNGTFTLLNYSPGNWHGRLKNGHQYTWTAYKA